MRSAKGDHSSSEALNVFVFLRQAPVKPAHLVILAVRVIVSALTSAKFIAAQQHRNPSRDKQGQKESLDQAVPQRLDNGIVAWSFHSAIVTVIGIASITAVLAIFVIMLLLVADQIIECESVMRSYKVQAACWPFAGFFGTNPSFHRCDWQTVPSSRVADPEPAYIVTKTPIPFRPALRGKTPHLIGAACIPGFRDNFYVAQDGILGNAFKKWSVAEDFPMLDLGPEQTRGRSENHRRACA